MRIDKSAKEQNTGKIGTDKYLTVKTGSNEQLIEEHDKILEKIFLNMTCVSGVCFWLNLDEFDVNNSGRNSGL
jgi:hypothetical protein